jgi:4-hydroxybenzoate polyprenyltransferase
VVTLCYAGTATCLALAAGLRGLQPLGWLLGLVAAVAMVRQGWLLRQLERTGDPPPARVYGRHFSRQVQLGGLLLLALIVGRWP